MKRVLFILIFLMISFPCLAEDLSFYFIYPEGEGDTDAAKPYITEFFDMVKKLSGVSLKGLYINDEEEGVEAIRTKEVDLAIVSPEFYDKFLSKFKLTKILQTIPSYSAGPYEKYYIMANKNVDILELLEKKAQVNLFASKGLDESFLNNQIFTGNDEIKKIAWALKEAPDIVGVIKEVAGGDTNKFILLTGYEFSVVNNLKKKNTSFQSLKLVFSSKELPSSPVVLVGSKKVEDLSKLKQALLGMSASLKGNLVLKKLRLKGFAGL